MLRRICGTVVLLLVFALAACGNGAGTAENGAEPTPNDTAANNTAPDNTEPPPPGAAVPEGSLFVIPAEITPRPQPTPGQPPPQTWRIAAEDLLEQAPVTLQLTPLTPGEELVQLQTNFGDIVIRLFPQAAPVAVENFLTHVANGFYDGLIFHRVMEGFMIQGGCAEGTGRAGQSIWGAGFGPEHNYDLWHFNGALAMAQTMMGNSIGSQFYIVHSDASSPQFLPSIPMLEHLLNNQDIIMYPEDWDGESPHLRVSDVHRRDKLEHYLAVGGTPSLDFPWNQSGPNFGHTVFGQVVQGMDIVNAIAATPTHPGTHEETPNRPLEDVVIARAFIVVHRGE